MTQPVLDQPSVVVSIREFVTASVPELMRMNMVTEARQFTGSLYHHLHSSSGKRPFALGGKDPWRHNLTLSLKLPEHPDLIALKWVHARLAPFHSLDEYPSILKIDLVPAHICKLTHPESVTIHQQDQ